MRVRTLVAEEPQTLTGTVVLGCDGANSTIRELAGIPMEDLGSTERWLVADIRVEGGLDTWDGVEQVCDPVRPATFMQVTGFDPLVNSGDIKVMSIGGDVTLAGTVPSYPRYLEAAAAARRVDGVSGVHNNLMVVIPDSAYRDDIQLITAANNALTQNVTVPDTVRSPATCAPGPNTTRWSAPPGWPWAPSRSATNFR